MSIGPVTLEIETRLCNLGVNRQKTLNNPTNFSTIRQGYRQNHAFVYIIFTKINSSLRRSRHTRITVVFWATLATHSALSRISSYSIRHFVLLSRK